MPAINDTIQHLLDSFVTSGAESGVQVAAYYQGNLVVDAWAGVQDVTSQQPVDGNTLFLLFSCSKGVTATIMHLLAERGLIDYDAPIAHYWPEFGQNGKAQVTIR